MTNSPVSDPSVSELLDDFFSTFRVDADDAMRGRVALVRQDFSDHMDEEGWRVLDPAQTVVLETEQQFGSKGFFARAAHASCLLCVLEHYLQRVHAQVGIEQRAEQLSVVAAMAEKLWTDRIISVDTVPRECRREFDLALRQGRSDLGEARMREQNFAN